MKKQSSGFVLRTFGAIFVAFVFVLIVFAYTARPVASSQNLTVYLSVDLIQDMVVAYAQDMSESQIRDFLASVDNPSFQDTELLTLSSLNKALIEDRYSVRLFEQEETCFLNNEAFVISGRLSKEMPRQSRAKHLKDLQMRGNVPFWVMWSSSKPSRSDCRNLGNRMGENVDLDVENDEKTCIEQDRMRRLSRRKYYLFIPVPSHDLMVVAPYTQEMRPAINRGAIILGTMLSLVIMLLTTMFLIMPVWIRLRRYEQVCLQVSHGDFKARCNEKRKDMLGSLARHIDEMTSANLNHLEQQKNLLQAVAHEMRTPLSRIRFSLEMLNIAEDDEKSLARLDSIDEDLTEVDSLIKELTYFNYVDAGNGRQHFEENDVKKMVEMTVSKSAPSLAKFNVKVEGLTENLTVEADATAFRRVIGNLLGNAIRYAKESICISVTCDGKMLTVAVEDDGPGIPAESRHEVFEPFASVDKARNKAHSGVGLGLAIASRIMKVHEGSIFIEDSKLGGCRMVTCWPLKHVTK